MVLICCVWNLIKNMITTKQVNTVVISNTKLNILVEVRCE